MNPQASEFVEARPRSSSPLNPQAAECMAPRSLSVSPPLDPQAAVFVPITPSPRLLYPRTRIYRNTSLSSYSIMFTSHKQPIRAYPGAPATVSAPHPYPTRSHEVMPCHCHLTGSPDISCSCNVHPPPAFYRDLEHYCSCRTGHPELILDICPNCFTRHLHMYMDNFPKGITPKTLYARQRWCLSRNKSSSRRKYKHKQFITSLANIPEGSEDFLPRKYNRWSDIWTGHYSFEEVEATGRVPVGAKCPMWEDDYDRLPRPGDVREYTEAEEVATFLAQVKKDDEARKAVEERDLLEAALVKRSEKATMKAALEWVGVYEEEGDDDEEEQVFIYYPSIEATRINMGLPLDVTPFMPFAGKCTPISRRHTI